MSRISLYLLAVAGSACLVQSARAECRSGEMSITSVITGITKTTGSLEIKNVNGTLCNATVIMLYKGEKAPKSCTKGATVRARGHVNAEDLVEDIMAHAKDIHCTK